MLLFSNILFEPLTHLLRFVCIFNWLMCWVVGINSNTMKKLPKVVKFA
jgi:hypothetical protein